MIEELKDSFSKHPVYSKLTPNIQNKYSFQERPQFGIVVKGSSANKVQFSADNFIGTVQSYCMLASVGQPTYPIEWIREDLAAVRANDNRFPTGPGIYFLELVKVPENASQYGAFMVDALKTVSNEPILKMISGVEQECRVRHYPIIPGTLRIWENKRFKLQENVHYSVDLNTGEIRLLENGLPGSILTADYRYEGESRGPIPYRWNEADFTTIPGVVLAWGKRGAVHDKIAVVIYDQRVEAAQAYGGKFEISFDLDVIAPDPIQMEEIADLTFMYLWTEKRPQLAFEGLEIVDVSIGGESEELSDETGDQYYYTASLSVQIQSDWETHFPLPLTVNTVTPTSAQQDQQLKPYSTIRMGMARNIEILEGLRPNILGRLNNYERLI